MRAICINLCVASAHDLVSMNISCDGEEGWWAEGTKHYKWKELQNQMHHTIEFNAWFKKRFNFNFNRTSEVLGVEAKNA